MVVIKVDLLSRYNIRKVQFFKTENTKETSLVIFDEHSESIVGKEILELIRREIKEYSFSPKKLITI
jgi:hypothetical protein